MSDWRAPAGLLVEPCATYSIEFVVGRAEKLVFHAVFHAELGASCIRRNDINLAGHILQVAAHASS